MEKRLTFRTKLLYFTAGAFCYAVGSCMFRSDEYMYRKNDQLFIRIEDKSYPINNGQMGSIEHRVRGLLNERPKDLHAVIEAVLQDESNE